MDLQFNYRIDEALTAIDGRNRNKLTSLIPYLSEFALNRFRILVEIRYLEKLAEYRVIRNIKTSEKLILKKLYDTFDSEDYKKIRKIESKANHDLKAVEEYVKLRLKETSLRDIIEMVHFGLTSDDVNNISYSLMLKESLIKVLLPELEKIYLQLAFLAKKYKGIPMLGRTHGQPAAPTTVGKEFLVYYKRVKSEIEKLRKLEIKGKLTGNTGNLNAHKFIYPKVDWLRFSREFVAELGLTPELVTTQILPYDSYLAIFNRLLMINNILLGFSQDMWIYILLGYFRQKVIRSEVGSTALPHKVNPIYFEGAEGGFGIANALFEFYSRKLSYSRLQRDLSDSTVRRSWSIAFAYSLLSYQSVEEALARIEPEEEKIKSDLSEHWEVLSEAIQNFLRSKGYKGAYEETKKFFRGKVISKEQLFKYIRSIKLAKEDRATLLSLTPEKYTGYAEEIVNKFSI